MHTKLNRKEPSRAEHSLSHPLSGLGARVGEDWGFEGRDGTKGPGAATAVAEPIWERGECVLGGKQIYEAPVGNGACPRLWGGEG